jgi:hypothetical protein
MNCILSNTGVQDYFPHIDASRIGDYGDVCVLSATEVTVLRRAHKALLLGVVLGAMTVRGEVVMFVGRDVFGDREVALGAGRSGALVKLMRDANQLAEVETDVNQRLLALSMDSRQRFVALLRRMLDTVMPRTDAVDPLGEYHEIWNLDRKIVEEVSLQEMSRLSDAMGDQAAALGRVEGLVSELAAGAAQGSWYALVDFGGLTLYQLKA